MELAAVKGFAVFLPCWLVKLVFECAGAACRFVITACWRSKTSATPPVINQEDVACPLDKAHSHARILCVSVSLRALCTSVAKNSGDNLPPYNLRRSL